MHRFQFSRERRHFIEAYVVLEEFVKELSTILDVRSRILDHILRWSHSADVDGVRDGSNDDDEAFAEWERGTGDVDGAGNADAVDRGVDDPELPPAS